MLFAACLALTLCLAGAQGPGCPGNQEWNDCGSPCTKVCWNRSNVCIEICVPKCECPKDTFWHEMDQYCYTGGQCDNIGLRNGTQYTPNWATTTPRPTTTTSTPNHRYCDWCPNETCDEYWDCVYEPTTTATTPDPRYCDWCPGGACDENWDCVYGTTTTRNPSSGYCDWCLFGACNENRACVYEPTTTANPNGYCDWCLYGECNENRACLYGPTQMPTERPSGSCYEKCLYGACNNYGDCDYGCADNRYGWDCSRYCSSNCLNSQCDNENGYCLHGCVNGTEGAFCEDYCPQGCYSEWMWGCDMDRDYYDCPYNQTCFDCGCQGWECVTNGTYPSSAPVTTSTPLLAVLSFAACGALLTLLLG